MFEKADEYLLKIFMNESSENNFNIFASNAGKCSLGGILPETGDAYALYKKENKLGLQINKGKYIFIQNRTKFINSKEFEFMLENDEELDEDELKEEFNNVDCVSFWETDTENGTRLKISYLVNKSSYLVTEYYKIFDNFENLSLEFKDQLLNLSTLKELGLSKPFDTSFDVSKNKIWCIVSENLHNNYYIKQNSEEITNLFLRKSLVKKATNESVESDIKSYMLSKDSHECIENIKSSLEGRFGKGALQER